MSASNASSYYWHLNSYRSLSLDQLCEESKAVGYDIPRGQLPASVFRKKLERCIRSLLCYHTCTQDELRRFAANRGIHSCSQREPWCGCNNRLFLTSALEELDEQRVFNFLVLPVDLRACVYDYYLEPVPETLYSQTTPSLSQTCRLLRQEVLPAFYRRTEIVLYIKEYSGEYRSSGVDEYDETPFTKAYLAHLPPIGVANLGMIRLVIERSQLTRDPDEKEINCFIDFRNGYERPHVIVQGPAEGLAPWWNAEERSGLERGLQTLLNTLQTVGGRKFLTLDAIHGLKDVVNEAAPAIMSKQS